MMKSLHTCCVYSLLVWSTIAIEVYIYYDYQTESNVWPPFEINCTDAKQIGNSCRRQWSTKIDRNDPKMLFCLRKCPRSNISKIQGLQPLKNGFSVLVDYGNNNDKLTCSFTPEINRTIRGLTITIDYKYLETAFLWGSDRLDLKNCSVVGDYDSKEWTEKRTFYRIDQQTQDTNPFDVFLILLIFCLTFLMLIVFMTAIMYVCFRKRQYSEFTKQNQELAESFYENP